MQRIDPVEGNTRPHEIERHLRKAQHRRARGGMAYRRANLVGSPHERIESVKGLTLVFGAGAGKVGHHAFKLEVRIGADARGESQSLRMGQTKPLHPAVEVEMDPDDRLRSAGGAVERFGGLAAVGDHRQSEAGDLGGVSRQNGTEHEDRAVNARVPEMNRFSDREHSTQRGTGVKRCAGDRLRTMTVPVRLDHGGDLGAARALPELADVMANGREINLGPGTGASGNRALRGTLAAGDCVYHQAVSHPPPRRFHASSVSARSYLAALVCGLSLIIVSACGGDQPEPQQQVQEEPPAATAEAEPVVAAEPEQDEQVATPPAPTRREGQNPLLLRIEQAEALERNGYWDEAAALRRQALDDPSLGRLLGVDELHQLQLDQVRLLLSLRRWGEAELALREFDRDALSIEAKRRHALLSAALAFAVNELGTAVGEIERYVELEGPASGSALLAVAMRLQQTNSAAATELAERAIEYELLPLEARRQALWLIARALDEAEEPEAARERFEQFYEIAAYQPDRVYALSRIGALSAELGDDQAAVTAWTTLVSDYPSYAAASEALDALRAAGETVDLLTAGVVLIEAGRYQQARETMLTVLGAPADASEAAAAEFYIADIHQRQESLESARLGYEATIGRDPSHPLAAESLMRLAEFSLAAADPAGAEQRWARVVREHPNHTRAVEAAWRWSWATVERGEWSSAAERFREVTSVALDNWETETQQRLLLWSALAAREAGDEMSAVAAARQAMELGPEHFYALRAALLIDSGWPALYVEEDAKTWLAAQIDGSPEELPEPQRLADNPRWRVASELRAAGFDRAADLQLRQWLADWASQPESLYALARFLHEQDETSAGARAGSALLRAVGVSWPDAPPEIVKLAYPRPWAELVAQVETRDDVDPLLLWGLIRRESFYDPNARGLAGEIGLTQVIPPTGGDIASGLGLEYEHEDLARPQLAIRFGAAYLGWQLEAFDQHPLIALAAYNAGPGNAARWLESASTLSLSSSLEDAFLAVMDYTSTQAYARYVIESWAAYWALEHKP